MALPIVVVGDEPAGVLAGSELGRCLALGTGANRPVVVSDDESAPGLRVGTAEAFRALGVAVPELPQVADPMLDDAIGMDVTGDTEVITGNNPRSVLIAAYRYMRELGCRWVRPGADGEFIPDLGVDPSTPLGDREGGGDR